MMQDGISIEDISFYTECDGTNATDRSLVSACLFTKPIVLHPIKYTTDIYVVAHKMLQFYKQSVSSGSCVYPFIVFCTKVSFAEFIVDELKK